MTKKDENLPAERQEAGLPDEMRSLFDIGKDMGGFDVRLPQIKILHQGGLFVMPTGESVKEFTAIMLHVNKANAFWAMSFQDSGGGTPPDCWSTDGVTPNYGSPDLQAEKCSKCAKNQWGSTSDKGDERGKACKNMRRIHVLTDPEANLMPFRLTAPPTSLKPIDLYLSQLVAKGLPYRLVWTTLGLKEAKNKAGIAYCELTFSQKNIITEMAKAQQIKQLLNTWLPIMLDEPTAEEFVEGHEDEPAF